MVTDPPYNMAYEGAGNTKDRKSKRILNDKMPEDEFAMTETLFAATGLPIPAPIASLRGKKVLHPAAIEKSCMSEFIREFLK